MTRTQFRVSQGILLDARRAVWIEADKTLVVADLHLGYAWAHRHAGQMLPLSVNDDTTGRLLELIESYQAKELIVLGDIVHRAIRVAAFEAQLCAFFSDLQKRVQLTCIAGNHDKHLQRLLEDCGVAATLVHEYRSGSHRFLHGDTAASPTYIGKRSDFLRTRTSGHHLVGRRHPINLPMFRYFSPSHPLACIFPLGSRWLRRK